MHERLRPRANGYTGPFNGLEISGRYVFVVEGHHIAALSKCQQGLKIIVRANPDIGDDLGGALIGRKSKNTQFDPESDGRLGGHSGQLTPTHNAYDT